MHRLQRLIVIATLSFSSGFFLLSHNTLRAEKKKIVLQQADAVEGGENNEGQYQSAIGHVIFFDGTTTLRCDRATEYEKEKKIVLQGNVVISDNSIELFALNGIYYIDSKVGELQGNVRGRMLDNSLVSKAARARFEQTTNLLWLYDDVVAWRAQQQLSGDTIRLHLRDNDVKGKRKSIDEIEVTGNAFCAEPDTLQPTPIAYNQLSANAMHVQLDNNSRITAMRLTAQSESLYHLYDEKQQPSGIHYSSGKNMRLLFTDGKLTTIKVIEHAQGKQYPAEMRGIAKLNLQRFTWREAEYPFKQKKSLP